MDRIEDAGNPCLEEPSTGLGATAVPHENTAHAISSSCRAQRDDRSSTELRLVRFAEHSSNALWIASVARRTFEYLSPAALRIWGGRRQMESLMDWEAVVHPADRPLAIERRQRVTEGECQSFQYRLVDEQGTTRRQVRETSFPMPAAQGEEACIGGIVEDVSPDIQVYLVRSGGTGSTDLLEMLRPAARRLTCFSTYQALMNVAEVLSPGCVIIDMRDIRASPLFVPTLLEKRPPELQVVLIGPADTSTAQMLDALRAGAVDYLADPVSSGALERAVHLARLALPARQTGLRDGSQELSERLLLLSRREREVLLGLVGGGTNKTIARTLRLSPRTVEVHRAHLMERLNVRTLTDLLHFARDAGVRPG